MSPLTRTMTNRGLPGWYAWAVVIAMTILLSGGAMAIAIRSSSQAIAAERAARVAAQNEQIARQAAQNEAVCVVVAAQVEAYRDPAPITPAGKNAAAAWRKLRVTLDCD